MSNSVKVGEIRSVTFADMHGVTRLRGEVIDVTERFIVLGSESFYAEVPIESVVEVAS